MLTWTVRNNIFSGLPVDITSLFLSLKKSIFTKEPWILCCLKTSLSLLIPCWAGTAVECIGVLPDCAISISAKDVSPHAQYAWQLQGPDDKQWNLFFPAAAHGIVAGFLEGFSVSWLAVVPAGKLDCGKEAGIASS